MKDIEERKDDNPDDIFASFGIKTKQPGDTVAEGEFDFAKMFDGPWNPIQTNSNQQTSNTDFSSNQFAPKPKIEEHKVPQSSFPA